jgi:hypothetical protein
MFPKANSCVLAGSLQGSTSMHHPRFIKLRFGILLSLLLLAAAAAQGQNPVPSCAVAVRPLLKLTELPMGISPLFDRRTD